jgi:hypothetical protein
VYVCVIDGGAPGNNEMGGLCFYDKSLAR